MTPNRVMVNRSSSWLNVCPSSRKSSSNKLLRVGSARARNTSSIRPDYVTIWSHVKGRRAPGGWAGVCYV